jgi:3'-phosphoadenosine 5'-phosphosulfate sulfotransferase (PAPS reductase)/FAD synthetase
MWTLNEHTGRVIVALSGGKASAWCAWWALQHYPAESVVLYFNDTKWEHPDLYRFLADLSTYLGKEITEDSDGRSVEDVFYDKQFIADNRAPFCSRILKAERLQRFYRDKDTIVFGIGQDEAHRAIRIVEVYQEHSERKKRRVTVRFPLVAESITGLMIDQWLASTGIAPPILYSLGFSHNNCSGGCVRAGKSSGSGYTTGYRRSTLIGSVWNGN